MQTSPSTIEHAEHLDAAESTSILASNAGGDDPAERRTIAKRDVAKDRGLEELVELVTRAIVARHEENVEDEALELCRLSDPVSVERATGLCVLIALDYGRGHYNDALQRGDEALVIAATRVLSATTEFRVLNLLSNVRGVLGDRALALDLLLRSLEVAERAGLDESKFTAYNNLAYFSLLEGAPTRALEYLRSASDLIDDDPLREAIMLRNRSQAHIDLGNLTDAEGDASEALVLARRLHDPMLESYALYSLAQVARRRGRWAAAIDLCCDSLATGCPGEIRAFSWSEMAECHRAEGDIDAAIGVLEQSLSELERESLQLPLIRCYEQLYETHKSIGRLADALRYHESMHALSQQVYDEQNESKVRALDVEHRVDALRNESEALRRKSEELARLNETIRELSIRDDLTGLYNRRHLFEQVDVMHTASLRSGHPLWVAMIDIDHFKRVNDSFGHATGDDVIHGVAEIIEAALRSNDLVARYGGEEFAVLLPDATLERAILVCERVRQSVSSYDWSSIHGDLAVSVSIGLASQQAGETSDALFAAADAQLYDAKSAGRNRISVASDDDAIAPPPDAPLSGR